MIFAESPTLNGGALFVGLLILIVLFAAACVLVFGGAVLAFRAGRGSRRALRQWAVLAGVAVVAALVPNVPYGRLGTAFIFVVATLAAHVVVYVGARATSGR
ncbi:MAG TPA: hypothetical protein VGV63_04730 [Acidimicrobiales bacterium]|nr:hypothetical protein [Acidimicrobiales bacterium]